MANRSTNEWELEFSRGKEYAEGAAERDLLDQLRNSYSPEEQRRIATYLRRNLKAVRTLADTAAIHEYEARALRLAVANVAEGGEVSEEADDIDDTPVPSEGSLIFAPKAFGERTYPAFCEGYALRYTREVLVALDTLTENGEAAE